MSDNINERFSTEEVKKRVEHITAGLKEGLKKLPSGRASLEMLDSIDVTTSDGAKQRIKHIASVKVLDSRTLALTPYNQHDKSLLGQISEGISKSALRLNSQISANEVVVKLSENTEERKRELMRAAHQEGEAKKRELRDLRQKYTNTKTLKTYSTSEDEQQRLKKDLDKAFKDGELEIVKLVDAKAKDFQ